MGWWPCTLALALALAAPVEAPARVALALIALTQRVQASLGPLSLVLRVCTTLI